MVLLLAFIFIMNKKKIFVKLKIGNSMRKLIFSILIIVSTLLFTNVESKGQCPTCPSPSSSESVIMGISGTSCSITINYCLFCSPTGHPRLELCSILIPYGPTSFCNNIAIDNIFLENVRKAKVIDGAVKCASAMGLPIGPCPNRTIVETYLPTCAKFGVPDEITGKVPLIPCPQLGGQCFQEWEICFNDPIYTATPIGTPSKLSGICDDGVIIIGPVLPSECFEICF